MKWGKWSTTAASNSAAPPDGWPEGQAPSTVNDCAREMMAAVATGLQDIQFVDLGFDPTFVSGTTFTVSGTHADVLHYGRRLKLYDGAATLYGTIYSSTATTNTLVALRFDAGNAPLDSSLSSFAIGSPSAINTALPDTAYRGQNYFDNPYLDIWQRGNGPVTLSSTTIVSILPDRWNVTYVVASAGPTVAVSRAAAAPTLAQAGVLINSSLRVSVNAAMTGLSATDFVWVGQSIEGYNFRNLAGKPMTLSVWVNSTTTGTYCMSMGNSGNNRNYVAPFSISSASTWEKKTFNIPESPTAGTWDYSSGRGLTVRIALAAGTGSQTVGTGKWTATTALATAAQINFLAGTGRSIMFTGWSLREGNQDIPLVPINYQDDLANCQRFANVYKSGDAFAGCNVSTVESRYQVPYPVTMRTNPVLSCSGGAVVAIFAGGGGVAASSTLATLLSGLNSMTVRYFPAIAVTLGQASYLQVSAGAQFVIKADI